MDTLVLICSRYWWWRISFWGQYILAWHSPSLPQNVIFSKRDITLAKLRSYTQSSCKAFLQLFAHTLLAILDICQCRPWVFRWKGQLRIYVEPDWRAGWYCWLELVILEFQRLYYVTEHSLWLDVVERLGSYGLHVWTRIRLIKRQRRADVFHHIHAAC